MEAVQLQLQERLGVDGEILQPTGVADLKLLQARAPQRGDYTAELGRAAEPDAPQRKLREPGEDALGRQGKAKKAYVERNRGGLLEAGKLKVASPHAVEVVHRGGHVVVDKFTGEAARGDGKPGRRGLGAGACGGDGDPAERCGLLRGFENPADAGAVGPEVEAELREEGPQAAPAAGEEAGPDGGGGVVEAREDEDEEVVRERAEVVLAVAGELRVLGGELAAALRH